MNYVLIICAFYIQFLMQSLGYSSLLNRPLIQPLFSHCISLSAIHCIKNRDDLQSVDSSSLEILRRHIFKANHSAIMGIRPLVNQFHTLDQIGSVKKKRIAKVILEAELLAADNNIEDKVFSVKILSGNQIKPFLEMLDQNSVKLQNFNWQDWLERQSQTEKVSHSLLRKDLEDSAFWLNLKNFLILLPDPLILSCFLDNLHNFGLSPELLMMWGAVKALYSVASGGSLPYSIAQGVNKGHREWKKFTSYVEELEEKKGTVRNKTAFFAADSTINRNLVTLVSSTGMDSIDLPRQLLNQGEVDRDIRIRILKTIDSKSREKLADTRSVFVYKVDERGMSYLYLIIQSRKISQKPQTPSSKKATNPDFDRIDGQVLAY